MHQGGCPSTCRAICLGQRMQVAATARPSGYREEERQKHWMGVHGTEAFSIVPPEGMPALETSLACSSGEVTMLAILRIVACLCVRIDSESHPRIDVRAHARTDELRGSIVSQFFGSGVGHHEVERDGRLAGDLPPRTESFARLDHD
jgi:hypothetical protein